VVFRYFDFNGRTTAAGSVRSAGTMNVVVSGAGVVAAAGITSPVLIGFKPRPGAINFGGATAGSGFTAAVGSMIMVAMPRS